ncbi:metal ion binding [Venturia nashicola]|uniref:Metal ion binding n=1 Tax=Venturia nashicola TaxID=86259 RepID=A0A4Z1P8M3_9PEZI|nr:metal ion binding [Venturia nashicola]
MTLRKSQTFNARTSISTDLGSPVAHARYMPKRSPTSPKALEDLVNEGELIAAHTSDIAKLLKEFDDKISGLSPVHGSASILSDKDVLALPSFMVQQVNVPEPMDIDPKPVIVDHHHDSDSGLGSSVASSTIGIIVPTTIVTPIVTDNRSPNTIAPITNMHKEHTSRRSRGSARSIASTHSTITSSATSLGSPQPHQHFLSKDAIRHIKKQIVEPILEEESLKEFHPLIEDIPRRIGARFISNLRDLEKTLFFLAPVSPGILDSARAIAHALLDFKDFSSSPKSFLQFCETSIQCLHNTVDYLCERDQRLPADRPYTNNYFLDLVEQIRRYAQIMARTRAKKESGEEKDEMDYRSDEEIVLEGGLSKNGRPAELVRKKDGKLIPLSERSGLDVAKGSSSSSSSKRPLSDDSEMDDEILRSMARRRKSDKPGDVMHPCAVCAKEFKRPCDLTKHEKTHSRPWKCPELKCRYHEQGWPTEKERDRHVNDKHSQAPQMYKCKFPPCTYSSKRESNCKQHMEKAHNWQYVRSKSNGRKKNGEASGSNRTSSEPLTPFIQTPLSATHHNFSSPESPFLQSPSMQPENNFGGYGGYSYTPSLSNENLFTAYDTRRESVTTAGSAMTYSSSNFSPAQGFDSAFEEALHTPEDVNFNDSIFDNTAMTFFAAQPAQQPTPAMSVNFDFNDLSTGLGSTNAQHLSPAAIPDVTLYSPHQNDNMHFDEALGVNAGEDMGFGQDFTLFGGNASADMANVAAQQWFPDTSNFGNIGGQFDSMF